MGKIDQDMADFLPLRKAGEIHLGKEAVQHIEEEHGKQIRAAGFDGAEDFIADVLANVERVYEGKGNRDFFLVSLGKKPWQTVIVKLEFDAKGDYYRIKTATPVRDTFFKGKKLLWERAPSSQLFQESPSAISGQSSSFVKNTGDGKKVNTPLGSMTPTPEGYAVRLFADANPSTLFHETGKALHLAQNQEAKSMTNTPHITASQLKDIKGTFATLKPQKVTLDGATAP